MFGSIRSATLSVKQSLCNSLGLPFPELLEIRELDELVKGAKVKYYNRIYTPLVTLLAFMAQVLDSDGSCRQAVSRIISRLSLPSAGSPPSQHTTAYGQARARLPLSLSWKLMEWSTQRIDAPVEAHELWLGRHQVPVVDGSSGHPPATEANRNELGLPANGKPGWGFPVLPVVGGLSVATGLFERLRLGKKGGHERH